MQKPMGFDCQQMGVRVAKNKYRRLKSAAALMGVPLRALVEEAIEEFLAKPVPRPKAAAEQRELVS